MKKFFLIGASFILLFMTSCRERAVNDSESNVISVDLNESTPLMDAIARIIGVSLNNSESEHFPGLVSKLEWVGDSIFVVDYFKDNGLYVYNSNGKLINCYTKKGNGPEEYLRLFDFIVTPKNIVLLDSYGNSNLIFLDRQLNFIEKKKAEKGAQHFALAPNGTIWYDKGNSICGDEKDKLVCTENDNRKVALSIPSEIENIDFQSNNVFSTVSNDTILYLAPTEPRIYKCADAKAEEFCSFDFNGLWPDYASADRMNLLEFYRSLPQKGKIHTTNILSEGDDIAYTFHAGEDLYVLLFKYSDTTQQKLLKITKEQKEELGELVCLKNGDLVFADPDRLLIINIKE